MNRKKLIIVVFILFNIWKVGFSETIFSEFKSHMERLKTSEEKRNYIKSLGVKKTILLGSEVWKKLGSEDAYWLGYYGILPHWKENPYEVVESVCIVYNRQIHLHPEWREMLNKSLWEYIKTIDIDKESTIMNSAIQFVLDKDNSLEGRCCVITFIGDLWFTYFENSQKLPEGKRKRIFEELNLQAEMVTKKFLSISSETNEIKQEWQKLLYRFYKFYIEKENFLPSEFLKTANFKRIQSIIKEVYLSVKK